MANMKTIDTYLHGRDNNYNLIRFLAAMAVIISHSPGMLLGYDAIEPLQESTGYTLGYHAVNVFFTLSGFLIAKSLITRNDLAAYAAARSLRLVPGLLMATLVTALVFGPVLTTLSVSEYFSNWSVWTYAPIMGSLVSAKLELPGLYTTLAIPGNVNEPLWTLRYEAVMYIGLALVFWLGMFAGLRRFVGFAIVGLAGYAAITWFTDLREIITPLDHLSRFSLTFLFGAGLYMLCDKIVLHWGILAIAFGLTWAAKGTPLYEMTMIAFTAYAVQWFGLVPGGIVRSFNKIGDYSYGIYIYGWPVQQAVALLLPGIGAAALFGVAFPVVLVLAVGSWYLVEKPALARRHAFADWMRSLPTRWRSRKSAAEIVPSDAAE